MPQEWYGVRTLVRWYIEPAEAGKKDVLEDRVVLLRAESVEEAIEKAEAEVRQYVRGVAVNPEGKEIRYRYLGACWASGLLDPIEEGVEVFSSLTPIAAGSDDEVLIDQRFGPELDPETQERFRDRDF